MRLSGLTLAVLAGLAACGPDGGAGRSAEGYADRIYAGRAADAPDARLLAGRLADDPDFAEALEIAEAQATIRRSTPPADLSLLQRARADARLRRQRLDAERAGRDLIWAESARAQAARDLARAELLDRRPVTTGPFDRADFERRQEALELSRAAGVARQAGQTARQAQARLEMLEREAGILERMDRMERMEQRQEARERLLATRSDRDAELRRLLPYRRTGESIADFRTRVERARVTAGRTGRPLEALLGN